MSRVDAPFIKTDPQTQAALAAAIARKRLCIAQGFDVAYVAAGFGWQTECDDNDLIACAYLARLDADARQTAECTLPSDA